MTSCLAAAALSLLALPAEPLRADGVHEGKWKVTTASPNQLLYVNATSVNQIVFVTACSLSGGDVNFHSPTFGLPLSVPDCVSVATVLASGSGQVRISLLSGTSASGTYQVTVNP